MAFSLFLKTKQDGKDLKDQGFSVSGKIMSQICQPCKSDDKVTVAIHKCLDCDEYMCSECSTAHIRFSITKNHKIDALKSDVASRSDIIQEQKRKVNLKLLASVNLKQGEGDQNEPLYSGLDYLPDGRLVAVDNWNSKCVVYNQQLVQTGSQKCPLRPLDVAVVSADEVVVTTGKAKKMYFLKVSGSGEVSLKRWRKVQYNYETICMMDEDSMLASTVDDPQHARVVSLGGEEKELDVTFPGSSNPIYNTTCAYIKNYNKVILTNQMDNNITSYDLATKVKLEFASFDIDCPTDVVVGPNHDIFVCSNGTDSIVQMSHTGQVEAIHKLNIKDPKGIGISKDNRTLAVFNDTAGNSLLQLYKIEFQ